MELDSFGTGKDVYEPSPESSNVPGPAPDQRHAQPSGPWPWVDIESLEEAVKLTNDYVRRDRSDWRGYPQCLFPNWTPQQVNRCGIQEAVEKVPKYACKIYCTDVHDDGEFSSPPVTIIRNTDDGQADFWKLISGARPAGIRVRCLNVENLSGPVLQMLGTKYIIEPFFFSSSLNWIPSRYQEEEPGREGDHITLVLTFLRSIPDPATVPNPRMVRDSFDSVNEIPSLRGDPQATLNLSSSKIVLRQDLLAIHVIRSPDSSTIISYHPDPEWRTTSAKELHYRIKLAGDSVYWQGIFNKFADPTFNVVTIMWHCLYTWDQSLERLYGHISWLEAKVIRTNDMTLTTELHIIRAHLLHYESLLDDFKKSIEFIIDTPNPLFAPNKAADPQIKAERVAAKRRLEQECRTLSREIERLERSRDMQNRRLKNVMNLVFSSVNIEDSKRMQKLTEAARDDNVAMKALTEAAVGDSAAMKQIAYLTMFFLPGSFVAGVFGMNVTIVNPGSSGTLSHYFATAIPLTVITIWIVMTFQSKKYYGTPTASIWTHIFWPYYVAQRMWSYLRTNLRINRRKKDDFPA